MMKDEYSLKLLMNELYEKKHLNFKKTRSKKASRFIKTPFSFDLEIFLSGTKCYKDDDFYLKISSFRSTKCPLCYSEESILYKNQLIIDANINPFFHYHMLLRPCKKQLNKEYLKDVLPNVKFGIIKSQDVFCREEVFKEDIEAMCDLALDTKDYYVTQAMRGSGASVPEHIHAHIFPKSQTDFPLIKKRCFTSLVENKIWVNRNITYALLYRGTPKEISEFFYWLGKTFSYSANHIIYVDEEFDGLIGVYIPRLKEIPYFNKFPKIQWKFGVFEVLGLFDAKSIEIYEKFDYEQASLAIKEVTIQDKKIQKKIEESCFKFLV